ncbi:MAG TPA: flavin reductase family protein [Methylomirabilota bacterium]|jgi:flavin reductase (DIM6/NTAB) family NADH-FMN oxidoreductase RutF|nr:flavin reductase family protein [Methylomirabilota bacterium]
MGVTPTEFRTALRCFAAGVTVVTTRDADGRPSGLTASAFTAVSLDPPLVLVCVDHAAAAYPAFSAHGWFAVNVLRRDQEAVSRRFALSGGDKFAGLAYHEGRARLPLLDGVLATLECRLVSQHEAGDHTIFVGEVDRTTVHGGLPLVYFHGAYHGLAPEAGAMARAADGGMA